MNVNCLEGLRCPECENEAELVVCARVWVSLTDDGTDPYADSTKNCGGTDYDDDSDARCPDCGYTGKLKDFKIKTKENEDV